MALDGTLAASLSAISFDKSDFIRIPVIVRVVKQPMHSVRFHAKGASKIMEGKSQSSRKGEKSKSKK